MGPFLVLLVALLTRVLDRCDLDVPDVLVPDVQLGRYVRPGPIQAGQVTDPGRCGRTGIQGGRVVLGQFR